MFDHKPPQRLHLVRTTAPIRPQAPVGYILAVTISALLASMVLAYGIGDAIRVMVGG